MKLVVEVQCSDDNSASNEWLVYDSESDRAYFETEGGGQYSAGYGKDWFNYLIQHELEMGRGVGQAWKER